MSYTWIDLEYIYYKTNGYCYHCGKKLAWSNYGKLGRKAAWEVDHSRARSKGGSDYFRNLNPSCIPCNRSKGALHSRQYQRLLYY